jgi:hypothetical protein
MSRQGNWPRGFFKWITAHGHGALLEGLIFQWANEQSAACARGERVTKVHPYTEDWGRFLAPEMRASLPKS